MNHRLSQVVGQTMWRPDPNDEKQEEVYFMFKATIQPTALPESTLFCMGLCRIPHGTLSLKPIFFKFLSDFSLNLIN